ncbi:MAG: hypothetical protein V1787_02725 [Candidatus Micrarchaeota archaeon]
MFSKQFESDSPPLPACLAAEGMAGRLAEIAGDDLKQACIVFRGGRAEFYYDDGDAESVARSVVRGMRKQPGAVKQYARDFAAHAKSEEGFAGSMPPAGAPAESLAEALEGFAELYSVTEAFAALGRFSLARLESEARACLETHLRKKGRGERISEILSGKPGKIQAGVTPAEAIVQEEVPSICRPYLDALPAIRKIQSKAVAANAACLKSAGPLFSESAKRLKLKPEEFRWLLPSESATGLRAGSNLRPLARERMRHCIFSQKEGFGVFYVGQNAAVFAKEVLGLHRDHAANK